MTIDIRPGYRDGLVQTIGTKSGFAILSIPLPALAMDLHALQYRKPTAWWKPDPIVLSPGSVPSDSTGISHEAAALGV